VSEAYHKVTALGLKSFKSSTVITLTNFRKMLSNRLYVGFISFPTFGIENQPADFQPIISSDLFDKVQYFLEHGHRSRANSKSDPATFPLRAFVRCCRCGVPITGSSSKGRQKYYAYYHCRNRACRSITVPVDKLHEQFHRLLAVQSKSAHDFTRLKSVLFQLAEQRSSHTAARLQQLSDTLSALEEKKRILVDARFVEKALDQETFSEQVRHVDGEIKKIRANIEKVGTEPAVFDEALLEFAEEVYKTPTIFWGRSSINHKRAIQHHFFPEGIVADGEKVGTSSSPTPDFITSILSACEEGGGSPSDDLWNRFESWILSLRLLKKCLDTPEDEIAKWRYRKP